MANCILNRYGLSGGGVKIKYLIKDMYYVDDFKIGNLSDGNINISLGRYSTVSTSTINTEDYTHLIIVGTNYSSAQQTSNAASYGIAIKFNGKNKLWCLRKGNNDYEQSNSTDVICGMDISKNYSGTITFKGDQLGGTVKIINMFLIKFDF